ncbi:hypothetical protein [Streptomyces sp. NPDC057623]|uniref:hypothetical protein n=1 Tax=Streptomyces sp. NPDC057623 TaxID=3346187 RepID=UPI0036B1CE6E
MSDLDERRIAELAKRPPRVTRGGASAQALKEARRVLEAQALIDSQPLEDGAGED